MKLCEYCQETQARKRFCSTFCKDEYHKMVKRQKNEKKLKQNPISVRSCNFCNIEFRPTRYCNNDQVFCSSKCKTNCHAKNQRECRERQRLQTMKNCPICARIFNPQKSMREIYCSVKCRIKMGRKIYKMMSSCYKSTKTKKANSSHKVLGYTPNQLLEHLQKHPNWDVIKKKHWHLDHIFPIIAFVRRDITDISLICCLNNLQPLSGKDNCQKNDNYDESDFSDWLANQSSPVLFNTVQSSI